MDFRLLQLLNAAAGNHAILDSLLLFFAEYGAFLFPAALLVLWFRRGDDKSADYRAVLLAAAAAGLGLLAAQVIGHLYFRPRPYSSHPGVVTLLLDPSPDPSFPSDHAVFAFAITTVLWLRARNWGLALLPAAVLLALSRVYCGTHYPSDVTGGALLGAAAAGLLWMLRRRLEPLLSVIVAVAARLHLARTGSAAH